MKLYRVKFFLSLIDDHQIKLFIYIYLYIDIYIYNKHNGALVGWLARDLHIYTVKKSGGKLKKLGVGRFMMMKKCDQPGTSR